MDVPLGSLEVEKVRVVNSVPKVSLAGPSDIPSHLTAPVSGLFFEQAF